MPDQKRKGKVSYLGKWLLERVVVPSLLKILEGLVLVLPPAALKNLPFPWET